MTPGLAFVLAHLLGDWILQTPYQAAHKGNGRYRNGALWRHCLVYTAVFFPVFWVLDVNFWWLGFVLATHVYVDRRTPVTWFLEHVKGNDPRDSTWTMMAIMTDQIFHLVVLCVILWAEFGWVVK